MLKNKIATIISNLFNFIHHCWVYLSALARKKSFILLLISYIITFYIIYSLLYFIISIYLSYSDFNVISFVVEPGSSAGSNFPSDPVRYWPSGVPQSTSIVASGVATYMALRKAGVSPRVGAIFALGAGSVSASVVTVQSIIGNPVGFSRFMSGLIHYRETKKFPSLKYLNQNPSLNEATIEIIKAEVENPSINQDTVAAEALKAWDNSSVTKFLDDSMSITEFLISLYESAYKLFLNSIEFGIVEGYLDDLIGQRLFLEFILFMTVIFVILLFILFITNLLILNYKDKLLSIFTNKYLLFILKYELFLSKVLVLIIPIFVLIGLLNICYILYWLISNPIPYESLGIDLHQSVSSNNKV